MTIIRKKKYFVGIDLGTGSTKAVAVDEFGKTMSSVQHHYPTLTPQTGYSEQNPQLIWDAFIYCLTDIVETHGMPAAVSFSSAMHSLIPVDEQGAPLANAMLWADARSGEIAQALRDSPEGEEIYRNTGTAIYAMSPLCKIMWLRQNEAEIFQRAHKFISIKEYIWFKLFGVFEVDHSVASATGLLDIVRREWHHPSLRLAGIATDKLSTPVATTYSRFLITAHSSFPGIPTSLPFIVGASDGCCANLGGNAIRPGVAALTIGTSGAIRVGSDKPAYNYRAMTFNYLLNDHTFICGGAVNNGGAAVDWLLNSFLKIGDVNAETYDRLFSQIARVEAGSNGLIFLPYLYAERAPVWDAKSSGAFLGITHEHQQQHFLRAALEGICFALYNVLHAVEETSEKVNEIVVSGGFIFSAVWVQVLADITGKRLLLLPGGDSSSIGAVYLAMQALGMAIDPIQQAESAKCTVVEPDEKNHLIYRGIFPIYKMLYSNLKESMHQLHALQL